MTRALILVTCRDSKTAREFTVLRSVGARAKRNRSTRVMVSVPQRRLDEAIDLLDDSDDVNGFEYELGEEE